MTTTKTIAQLEDELQTIDAVITRERESEQRSSRTAWSRVPGLLAERDQVVAKIQLAREPQDRALQLAKAIVALRSHDTIAIAHLLREALAALAQQPATVALPEGVLLVTPEQLERHTTTAWECPPQSLVVLVSSLKRLHDKNSLATTPSVPVAQEQADDEAAAYQMGAKGAEPTERERLDRALLAGGAE